MKINVEIIVSAPIEEAWRAYTTPEDIMQWNAASDDWHTTKASVDLRIGGEFSSRMEAKDGSYGFDFAGIYTNVVTNSLLEYEFGGALQESNLPKRQMVYGFMSNSTRRRKIP